MVKKKKRGTKHRGFTMIELLAVLVILAILLVSVIISVKTLLERANQKYYGAQEAMLTLAGKVYFQDYRTKLPKEIGPIEKVSLQTLIDEKYIEPLLDRKQKACQYQDSYVYVQQVKNETYQYKAFLSCGGYHSEEDTESPKILYNPAKKISNQAITVQMSVTDNKQVVSYRYQLEKDGIVLSDTGFIPYEKPINITFSEEGTYRIKGYAYDAAGNDTSKTSGKYTIDKTPPNCNEVGIKADKTPKEWIRENVNFRFTFPEDIDYWDWYTNIDGGVFDKKSKNSSLVTTKTLSANGKRKGQLILYDTAGNHCTKTTDEYWIEKIDLSVKLTGSRASGVVGKDAVTLTAVPTPSKAPSGYTYTFERQSGSSWISEQTGTSKTYKTSREGSTTWRVKVTTGTGLEAYSNPYVTNLDTTPPSCSSVRLSANINTYTWTANDISVAVNPNNSDIKKWDFLTSTNGGSSYTTLSSSNTGNKTVSLTSSGIHYLKIRAYDEVGNSCESSGGPYYIDKTTPSVSIYGSVSSGTTSKGNVTLYSDVTTYPPSGISDYTWQYQSGSSWYTIGSSSSYTASGDQDRWYRLKVTSGTGKTAYSNQFRVIIKEDKPNCGGISFSGSSTYYWYTSGSPYVNIQVPSNSNISKFEVYVSTNNGSFRYDSTNYGSSKSLSFSSDGKYAVYVVGYNSAGNSCTSSTSGEYWRDTTRPSCSHKMWKKDSGGETYIPGTWSNKSVYTSVIDTSDNLSGFDKYILTYSGRTTNRDQSHTGLVVEDGTSYLDIDCYDVAGNQYVEGRNYVFKTDYRAPTISSFTMTANGSTYKPGTTTKGPVHVEMSCDDTKPEEPWIDVSGVSRHELDFWGKTTDRTNPSGTGNVVANGTSYARARCCDYAGNCRETSEPREIVIKK